MSFVVELCFCLMPTFGGDVCTCTVRLGGGSSWRKGRLEVFHLGEWGTVCNDNFTDAAAAVACRSLGFTYVSRLRLSFLIVWVVFALLCDATQT